MTSAPASGTLIKIKRITPYDEAWVTWQDGSVLLADDLNAQAMHVLFLLQENNTDIDTLKLFVDNHLTEIIATKNAAVTAKDQAVAAQGAAEDAQEAAEDAQEAAEIARDLANAAVDGLIPYAFGKFWVENGDLYVGYFGTSTDALSINTDGELILTLA